MDVTSEDDLRRQVAAADAGRAAWGGRAAALRGVADRLAPLLADVLEPWTTEVLDGPAAARAHGEVVAARMRLLLAVAQLESAAQAADLQAGAAARRHDLLLRELRLAAA